LIVVLAGLWLIAAPVAAEPDKGDAQICVINAWLRQHYPASKYLPENGWNDFRGFRCPDEPLTKSDQ
jgi:hypothetical protein